ncbi:MAG: ATP-binding protein [Mycobacterium sp.]
MTDVGGELQRCLPGELKSLFLFESLSDEQLAYLCGAGRIEVLGPGPMVAEGDVASLFYVLIDGELVISKRSAGRDVEINRTAQPGVYFGARSAFLSEHDRNRLSVRATRRSRFFVMDAAALGAFVKREFPMAVHLIEGMAETADRQHRIADERDRLLALGQLSAALTHELNNPAAAVVRAATELRGQLEALTAPLVHNQFDRETLSFLAAAQTEVAARVAAASGRALSAMQATNLEDEIGDWLSDHRIDNAWDMAPTFVEAGLDRGWLEQLATGEQQPAWLGNAMQWLRHRVEAELLTHQIHDAAQRISGLVADVKQYTQLNSAPFQFADVNALLSSTLRMFAGRIGTGTEIEVLTDFDESTPELLCYPAELNQVWTNIIDNAIAAMGPAAGTSSNSAGTLTVRTRREDDAIRIEIGDTGCGIPDDVGGRIFDPFFTTRPLGEGTGLGLHVAWRIIVNRHRGELVATSRPGDTRFVARLPLQHRAEGEGG